MELNQKVETKQKFPKKVGLAECKVLVWNPTRYELNNFYGREQREDDKEIDYTYTTRTGKRGMRIKPLLQDVKTGTIINDLTFFVEEDMSWSMDETKKQYVNSVGVSRYSADEEGLSEWFKKAMSYRHAHRGEAEVMEFLRSWMTNIDLDVNKTGTRNDILLNMTKLLSGDTRELNNLVNSEFAGTVMVLVEIEKDKDQEPRQHVYSKEFLRGYCIQYFRPDYKKELPKFVQDYINEIKGTYGPKGFYVLEELRDYDPSENPVESNSALLETLPFTK